MRLLRCLVLSAIRNKPQVRGFGFSRSAQDPAILQEKTECSSFHVVLCAVSQVHRHTVLLGARSLACFEWSETGLEGKTNDRNRIRMDYAGFIRWNNRLKVLTALEHVQ